MLTREDSDTGMPVIGTGRSGSGMIRLYFQVTINHLVHVTSSTERGHLRVTWRRSVLTKLHERSC